MYGGTYACGVCGRDVCGGGACGGIKTDVGA